MKNILKNIFLSKKRRQKQLDKNYAELDRILKLKRKEQEYARAVAEKASKTEKASHPAVVSKKTPTKKITVTVTKVEKTTTAKKPTAKKPAPKKK